MDTAEGMRHKYRALFGTELGAEVLNHMLFELHFFNDELNHPHEIALHNYSKRLLWYIGVWEPEYIDKVTFVTKILELPLLPEEKDAT